MRINEKLFKTELAGLYPPVELEAMYKLILEHLGFSPSQILLREEPMGCKGNYFVEDAILRLQKFEPIQYILGYTSFYGQSFKLNTHTLIPRPETEELVQLVFGATCPKGRILEIGTGSGCIAISLKKYLPESQITAMDISLEALDLATENARDLQQELLFIQDDILHPEHQEAYDLYVSNPPYVMEAEKSLMRPNVLRYEPATALFVPDGDPLVFYRAILNYIAKQQNGEGAKTASFFFEINENLGRDTCQLATELGAVQVQLHQDLNVKDRFVTGRFECD